MDEKNVYPINPLNVIHDITRFREIVSVLAKHGFGQLIVELAKGDTAIGKLIRSFPTDNARLDSMPMTLQKRICLVFQDLGPTFIKLGQILSTRPDLVPDELIEELKNLQDNVPSFSFSQAKYQIESELGASLPELFSDFSEIPLGTASIGQVYQAVLKTGEEVVVKVQRPGVAKIIESDVDLLQIFARNLEKRFSFLKGYDLSGIINEFNKAIRKEIDYSHELRNVLKFADTFKGNKDIVIPAVYKEFSTKKILTMEKIKGKKITQAEEVGSDRTILAKVALRAVFTMVFKSGFFHADPHPGNIFALPENRIAFLDLGMVGRLSEGMRFKMADLIVSLLERDVENIARILLTIGLRKGKVNHQQFCSDISEIMDKVMGVSIREIQFCEILKDLMDGARRNNLKIPNEYTLMGKALLTVESVGKELDPNLDVESEISPFIRKLVLVRHSPKQIMKTLVKRFSELYHWSSEIPLHLMTVLDDLQSGNLKIKIEYAGQGFILRSLEKIVGKLSTGLITSSLIVSSAIFITSRKDSKLWGFPVTHVLGLIGYLIATILGIRIVRAEIKSSDFE